LDETVTAVRAACAEAMVCPRRLVGASGRPPNFTVRQHAEERRASWLRRSHGGAPLL